MNIKKIIRYFLVVLIIAVATLAIIYVYQYDKKNNEVVEKNIITPEGWEIYLKDLEFSAICFFDASIYVGGVDGLYQIKCQTKEFNEILKNGSSFELVKTIEINLNNDGIWVGDKNGMTLLKDNQSIAYYNKDTGLPGDGVNDIKCINDSIYVATFDGVAIIQNNNITILKEENGLAKNLTKTILIDDYNNLWCGSYTNVGGGITILSENREIQYFNTNNGIPHNAITSITRVDRNNIWIGGGSYTEGGAASFVYKDNQWELKDILLIDDGLIGAKVRHIFIDKGNNIWFCSELDGIAIFKENGEKIYLTVDSGLSDNEAKRIVYDYNDNIWLATRRGVTKISSKWLEENVYSK